MATKVLIIDDDQDILESTGIILSSEGFEVHTADSVEQGMQMIESVGPDVVLLDIVFPESTTGGFAAAHTIKARYPRLPIIAFSAVNREYSLSFTREQIEADEFLSKPVRAAALMDVIRRRVP
jgi:DNA-binding NtrC family response regulator